MRQPTVSIAVKPNSNTEVPEEAQRVLRNELQVKYLESIGAAPTKANLAMLRKNIPSESIRFTTAWKSNLAGEPDYLKVFFEEPTALAEKSPRPRLADGSAVLELSSALEQTNLPTVTEQAAEDAGGEGASVSRGRTGGMSFNEAQRSYLYPFKALRARKQQEEKLSKLAATHPRAKASRRRGDDGDSSDAPSRKYVSRDPLRYQMYADEDVAQELHEELRLHTKEIVALQVRGGEAHRGILRYASDVGCRWWLMSVWVGESMGGSMAVVEA